MSYPILCRRMTADILANPRQMAMIHQSGATTSKPCGTCSHPIIVSPSSRDMLNGGGFHLICHECQEKVPGIHLPVMTPEQLAELERFVNQTPGNN